MSWKSLLTAGFAVCVLSSSVMAAPSIMAIPRPYSAASGGIQWEIFVTQNDPAYTGSLSVELPFTLTNYPGAAGASLTQFVKGDGGDNTNGAATDTWYYNETTPGS